MAGTDDDRDCAKVARAAQALIERYGDLAHDHAAGLERTSAAKAFAAAVRSEVARRLREAGRDK